tara:strand:- start:4944 stop:5714 length:771 start_codon:yes stop_codon:yes gene_type:complete
MDKPLSNNTDQLQNLRSITTTQIDSLYSDSDRFTIFLLDFEGGVKINFNTVHLFGKSTIALCPGEVLQLNTNTSYQGYSFKATDKLIDNPRFQNIFGNPNKVFDLNLNESKKIVEETHTLENLIRKSKANFQQQIDILFSLVMTNSIPNQEASISQKFIILVHEFYKRQHRMKFYAKNLDQTDKKLSEIFYDLGLASPHQFIKERILTEAKRLLTVTDMPICAICYELGFNDPAYFSRFFKKNTGLSASIFRNSLP